MCYLDVEEDAVGLRVNVDKSCLPLNDVWLNAEGLSVGDFAAPEAGRNLLNAALHEGSIGLREGVRRGTARARSFQEHIP